MRIDQTITIGAMNNESFEVNGQFAAAELHPAHCNSLLDLAVVGVLVNVGSPVNTVIDEILRNASTE